MDKTNGKPVARRGRKAAFRITCDTRRLRKALLQAWSLTAKATPRQREQLQRMLDHGGAAELEAVGSCDRNQAPFRVVPSIDLENWLREVDAGG